MPRLAMLVFASCAMLTAQEAYRDPQQRFTVNIPAGWNATPDQSGVNIVRGRAYARIVVLDGSGDAPGLVNYFAGQVSQQWRGWTEIRRDNGRLGGLESVSVIYGGANPSGIMALFKITAGADGRRGYAILSSAPQEEFIAARGEIERLEASFSTGGAAPHAPAPYPTNTGAAAPSDPRIAALDAAYKAGVLTREEYEAKKRQLGGNGSPAAAPRPAGAQAPAPSAGPGYQGASNEYQAPDRSYITRVPKGLRSRQVNLGSQPATVFEPESGAAERIILISGLATAGSIQEMAQQAIGLVGQMFPGAQPIRQTSFFQVGGAPAADIVYSGRFPAGEIKLWNGMILKDRFFYAVLGIATPATYGQIEEQSRFLLTSMRPAGVPENIELARAIQGRWTYYEGNSSGAGSNRSSSSVNRQIVFANGRFEYRGSVWVDTSLPGGGGGNAGKESVYTGTYRIFGNTLYAQIDQGGQAVYGLEVVQGGGMKIDGMLYIRE